MSPLEYMHSSDILKCKHNWRRHICTKENQQNHTWRYKRPCSPFVAENFHILNSLSFRRCVGYLTALVLVWCLISRFDHFLVHHSHILLIMPDIRRVDDVIRSRLLPSNEDGRHWKIDVFVADWRRVYFWCWGNCIPIQAFVISFCFITVACIYNVVVEWFSYL